MGGSRRGGGDSGYQQQQTVDPMIAIRAMQAKQEAEQRRRAEEDRQRALIESQKQSGLAAAQQGEALAKQQLGQYGAQRQAMDKSSFANQQQAFASGGAGTIGGYAPSQTEKIAAMGQGAGTTPIGGGAPQASVQGAMAANAGAGGTQSPVNRFAIPSASGIKFGGS